MRVHSALADMSIGIGGVRREGNDLVLEAAPESSIDATIVISASEVLCTLGKVLSTPSSLLFVLGLPLFWLRERIGPGATASATRPALGESIDINKPW